MKIHIMTRSTTPALTLIAWMLLTQTAHCFYNPSTGRWLSRDPVKELAGPNLYLFVGNTPISGIDRNGLIWIKRLGGHFNRCRDIDVLYKIGLENTPQSDGFIVQHLTIEWFGLSCDLKKDDHLKVELWEEVQLVAATNIYKWSNYDVNQSCYPLHPKSKGFVKIVREVKFFPISVTGNLEILWPAEPIPGWGTNRGVTDAPSWWETGAATYEPVGKNSWSVVFNCCCPAQEAKFKDTAPGEDLEYDDK